MCGSTVAGLYCPPPLPGPSFTAFGRKGGGGASADQVGVKNPPGLRSTLAPPKTIVIIKWGRGMVVPLPPSRNSKVHYTLACNRPPPQTEKRNLTKTQPTATIPASDDDERRKKKKRKKNRCGSDAWVYMLSTRYGSRAECSARKKKHKGKPKPQEGFGFPQRLRERKTERKTSPTNKLNTTREREGTTNIWADKGQVLKGEKTRQQSNPKDKKHHTEYPTSIPEKLNKNQIQNQQSLGGFVTAGWRGPWAALHSWGVTPGDRSTEGYKYPPTTGTAPGGAKSGQPT